MTFRRRAVSTAYYAVFHAIAEICANYVTRSEANESDEYGRVYRSLDHGSLKNAFGQAPLKSHPKLSRVGSFVVQLQAERHRADYLPPSQSVFSGVLAAELVDLARNAVNDIELIGADLASCRTLATCLLFKDRRQ